MFVVLATMVVFHLLSLLGGLQNAVCKGSKNLFDPTKDVVFIPLDDDLKQKAKLLVA